MINSTSKREQKGRKPVIVKRNINAKRIAYSIILALIGGVLYILAYQYTYHAKLEQKYQATQVQLQEKAKSLEKTTTDNANLQNQVQQLEQQKQQLEQQLQAKANMKARAIASSTVITGDKMQWLMASGIPSSDWGYVDYIISHESGWRPDATNASSGAHGLPQALPYSKTGCGWVDAVCQLQWADRYARSRYGGWAQAYNYWLSHHNW